jgi:hypothetical protein
MEHVLGGTDAAGKHFASIVRRVLELAAVEGHPDPRHEAHWWKHSDWTIDGRQWQYDGSLDRHTLSKKSVAEHEKRTKQHGFQGSGLLIERKLEGAFWGDKKYPNGRTSLRASASFPKHLWNLEGLLDDDEEEDDDNTSMWWNHLHLTAGMLKHRYKYDASICNPEKVNSLEFDLINEQIHYSFLLEKPFASVLASHNADDDDDDDDEDDDDDDDGDYGEEVPLLSRISFYICTDDFAVKAEQQSPDACGVPSLSVSTSMTGIDAITGKLTTYSVIAEAPMPVENFAENLQHRIAGFVFRSEADPGAGDGTSSNDVHITYVESSLNDLQTLEADEKDSFLEDRALIVHRLVANSAGWDPNNTSKYVQNVRTRPGGRPDASLAVPPIRTLETMYTVQRADPRWPLKKPNTVCLECGCAPKSVDPNSKVDKLFTCSKCRVRPFCSKECLAMSWKSDVWPHRVECKRAQQQDEHMVGSSLRENFQNLAAEQGIDGRAEMDLLEQALGLASLDEKSNTVEEFREQRQNNVEGARKARKATKKKRGKKK